MDKIAFVISHRPDNRYLKRINVLNCRFKLDLVFWNKSEEQINPVIEDVGIHEIHIAANQTNPLKRLPQTWEFIDRAYHVLKNLNPDIIYVGNLDMLYIARKYKHKINDNAKIVYEIADLHRLIIDKQKGIKRILSAGLKRIEKNYIKDVGFLVLTSMKFYEVYYQNLIEENKVVFLPNMPEEATFTGYTPNDRNGEPFTIGFIGWIRYKDQLRMLIEAAGKVGCNVLFAGADGDGPEFEKYCEQFPYVKFLGSFNYEEKIKELYDQIDCVYAVYDADWANVRVALPNKLYEAILCEKPIIVAKYTYLGELVKKYGVGIEVDHHLKEDLVKEILKLKTDTAYYNKLVSNCRATKKNVSLEKFNSNLISNMVKLKV